MSHNDQVITAGNQMSAIIPQVWSQRYYDVLMAELPFNSLISKDYEGEIQNLGDTVRITTFPEFAAATELEEDASADADSIAVTQQQLVINRRIVKDFILSNLLMLQSLPAMDKLRELAVHAIQKRVELNIVSDIFPAAGNAIAYDTGTTLTLADLLEAKEILDTKNVPLTDRHMILGAAQMNDIFNITGFTSSDFLLAGSPLQTGVLPAQLLGFMPHYTTEVGNTAYLFHSSFYTMASQQGVNIKLYDLGVEGKRAARVNVDTLCGFKQLDGNRVVTIG